MHHERQPMDQLAAHLDRAWDLVTRGDFTGAALSAEQGLEIDANSPEAHNLLGFIRAQEGDADAALQHYYAALEEDDLYVEAMLNAAELLIHPVHDFENALRLIDDAIELCEGSDEAVDAILLKADCFLHQGDTETTKKVLERLPASLPDAPSLKLRVGRMYLEVGTPAAGLDLLKEVVAAEPENSEAFYSLGLVLDSLEDTRGATIAFLQTRELDTRLPPVPWALSTDQFENRLQRTIHRLPKDLARCLENALVVVVDQPGAEVVADGLDPRIPLLLEAIEETPGGRRAGRLFVYQRNVERLANGVFEVEEELQTALEHELSTLLAIEPHPATGAPAATPAETEIKAEPTSS